jgi:hypothetical protein
MENRALGGGYITTLLKSDEIFERDNPLELKKSPGTSRGNSQKNLTLATLLAGLLLSALTGLLLLLAWLLLAAAALLLTGLALTALLLAGILLVRIVHKCS